MTDWPVKTLGDLLEVSIGGIWGSEAGEDEVNVFVYRSTELIKDGHLKEELTVRRSISARQLDSRKLEEGDLLLEKSGGGPKTPVGRVGLVKVLPGLSVCSNFMQLMRPRKKDVLPVYLHYFLNHFHVAGHTEDLQNNSTNIRNLKTTEYMDVEIPLPPLVEQKRIVALLDAATARVTELTACYEQARTHANNLFTSALREALESNSDWPVKTIGEICIGIDRQDPAVSGQTEFTYIDLSAVNQMTKQIDDARTLPVNEAPGRARQLVKSGDVLVSTVRPNLNAVALVGSELNGSTASTGFCVLRPNRTIVEPGVLFAWARNQLFIDELTSQAKGASYPAVTDNVVKALEIPVPPLEEQKQIVARLDSMRAKTSEMVAAYDAKLTAAKNLRQSILEAAFWGDF
jgi:type I restriction enzyme S subunit